MIQRRFYTILSVPVFLYLYSYTAVLVFLILIMAYLRYKRGIRLLMSFWAKTVFPIMGKKLHIEGKHHTVAIFPKGPRTLDGELFFDTIF